MSVATVIAKSNQLQMVCEECEPTQRNKMSKPTKTPYPCRSRCVVTPTAENDNVAYIGTARTTQLSRSVGTADEMRYDHSCTRHGNDVVAAALR